MKHRLLFIIILLGLSTILIAQSEQEIKQIIQVADNYIENNDYHSALSKINEGLGNDPRNPRLIAAKVDVLVLFEEYKEAWKIINESLDLNPNFGPLLASRGKLLILYKGKYKNAIEDFNAALVWVGNKDERRTENKVYVNRGAAYQKLGEYDLAMEDYSKAVELNPNDPDVYMYRGVLSYERKKYREGITDFDLVIRIDQNHHYALYNRGMCYLKLQEEDNACDDFHRSCELGNTNGCKMVIANCIEIQR